MALFSFRKKENIEGEIKEELEGENNKTYREADHENSEVSFRYVQNSNSSKSLLNNDSEALNSSAIKDSPTLVDKPSPSLVNNESKDIPIIKPNITNNNDFHDNNFNDLSNKNELIKNISVFDSNSEKTENPNDDFFPKNNIFTQKPTDTLNTSNNIIGDEKFLNDLKNNLASEKLESTKTNMDDIQQSISNELLNNLLSNSVVMESIFKENINKNLPDEIIPEKKPLNVDIKNNIDNIRNNLNIINKDNTFLNETNKSTFIPPAKIENPIKIETNKPAKEEKVEKQYSEITALATTRPVEVCYDLINIYQDEPLEKFDIYSNDEDLDKLISSKPKIKCLDISDCNLINDYSKIGKLKDLEELDLSGSRELKDLSFLNNLTKLRVLNIGNIELETLVGFPLLPNLQVLNLKMNKIKNLEGLESFTGLHDLVLWGCPLDNLDVLSNFKELRLIDLDSCSYVKEISAIAKLEKLVYLNLNFTKIEDLTPIKNLINLEIFLMDFTQTVISDKSLAAFEKLTKIKFLALRNRMIKDLSYFKNMTEMYELEISGNAINDLSPLENMEKMEILNIATNPGIVDLSPLHKMNKLKKLIISGTGTVPMMVSDFSVLENFKELETFECKFNKKVKDISPVRFCPKLKEVHFSNSFGVADVTPLRFCKNIVELYLENCTQIRDLSFIKYLTKIMIINIFKTSADRLLISDWTRFYDIADLRDGEGTLPIHGHIINSIKFRKKMCKIAKKAIKKS